MKYKVSVIKKIAFLVMTMALAVALAGCSSAVGKPGPAGPQGPPSEPVTPTEPTQPTEPTGGPVPVQKIEGIDSIIFNDSKTGEMDTEPQTVMLANHFYPSGLTYELDGALPGKVSAEVIDEDVLTVSLKSDAPYDNFMLKVKASNEISSATITFAVRRNQPPMVAMYVTARDAIPIWVGSQSPKELKLVDVAKEGDTCTDEMMNCVSVYLNGKPPLVDASGAQIAVPAQAFFYDDSGNTLEFVPENLSTSEAAMLDVNGGSKVTLRGVKTTNADEEDGIIVDFTARDDNGLTSLDTPVLVVKIDTAPTKVGAIGTRVIKASVIPRTAIILDVRKYFADDRDGETAENQGQGSNLTYYAWSDKPMYALVVGNEGNAMGKKADARIGIGTTGDTAVELTINAVDPGEAMITVMAVETPAADNVVNESNLEQWVEQTFKVVVKLD